MPYLTPLGLQIPTIEELQETTTAEQRAAIDAALAAGPDTVIGMLNGIAASHEREAWEAIQAAHSAVNPDNAEGTLLENVSAISGTTREPATASAFKGSRRLTVTLDPGATVTDGVTKFAYTPDPTIRFVATETVTNGGAVQDDFPVAAVCEQTGPIEAPTGTVTTIATPTTGIAAVTNGFDAAIGRDTEKDEALRQRRERELRQGASCSNPALVSDLYAYTDAETGEHPILGVVVLENKSDALDANGLPAHSFEAVIWDGVGQDADDLEVAKIIERNQPLGNPSQGSTLVTDPSLNVPQSFSRATQRAVEVEITLRKDSTTYAGDDAVKAAIAAYGQATQAPEDGNGSGIVEAFSIASTVLGVAGVNRVTLVRLRFASGSWVSNTDLSPNTREVAVIDSGDVTVIATSGL